MRPYAVYSPPPQIRSFLQPPMEGVVLQTYGAGNIPDTSSHDPIFEELKSACERGMIIVNCTQCSQGFVTESYAGGIVSVCVCVHTHYTSDMYM